MELRVREKGGGGGKYPYVLGQELPSSDPRIEIGRRLVKNGVQLTDFLVTISEEWVGPVRAS